MARKPKGSDGEAMTEREAEGIRRLLELVAILNQVAPQEQTGKKETE